MISSMTGYSCATFFLERFNDEPLALTIELKSINARFFEVVSKMPVMFNHLETRLISILQRRLIRGRVYITIKSGTDADSFDVIQPNLRVVNGYLQATDMIKKQFKLRGSLSLNQLLLLPHVFISEKKALLPEQEQAFFEILDQAVDKLLLARQDEGIVLRHDFDLLFDLCLEKIQFIQIRFDFVMADKKAQAAQLRVLLEEDQANQEVKLKLDELYSALNKIDVHEEIIRFKSHLKTISACVHDQNLDKGKRLDFILQELLRETNTIMAKCSDYEISSAAVDIKVALEKCREQSQNIV